MTQTTKVDFSFDPGCPWCWITSRWLLEVREQRDLDVTFRSFSLYEKNKDDMPEEYLEGALRTHAALRVVESVRAEHGDAAVDPLYTAYGTAVHHDESEDLDHEAILASVDLPTSHAAAADDEAMDDVILKSMDDVFAIVGEDVGVPITIVDPDGDAKGFFGPVISPAPTGQAALDLFDAMVTAARTPGFFELKRTRDVGPQFGARPEV